MPPPLTPNTGPIDGSRRHSITFLPILPEPLRQGDAGRRLAFAGFGRGDRRDDDELAVLALGQPFENRQLDLAAVAAELLQFVGQDAGLLGDFGDRLQRGGVSDVEC